jgi:hypothetical protein
MRSGYRFHSFVLGIDSVIDGIDTRSHQPLAAVILSAETDDEVYDVIKRNIDATLSMCEECEAVLKGLGKTDVQDFAFTLGRRRGGSQ